MDSLNPDPTDPEIIRNYPVRQPLLWFPAKGRPYRNPRTAFGAPQRYKHGAQNSEIFVNERGIPGSPD